MPTLKLHLAQIVATTVMAWLGLRARIFFGQVDDTLVLETVDPA